MSNRNKQRGKYFENKIAEKIRLALNLKDYECKRNSNSGIEKFEFGDIYFKDFEKFPIFECKYGYNYDLHEMWPLLTKKYINFVDEIMDHAIKYNNVVGYIPFSFVVLSKPYQPIICISINELMHVRAKMVCANNYEFLDESYNIYIYTFDDLITWLINKFENGDCYDRK